MNANLLQSHDTVRHLVLCLVNLNKQGITKEHPRSQKTKQRELKSVDPSERTTNKCRCLDNKTDVPYPYDTFTVLYYRPMRDEFCGLTQYATVKCKVHDIIDTGQNYPFQQRCRTNRGQDAIRSQRESKMCRARPTRNLALKRLGNTSCTDVTA